MKALTNVKTLAVIFVVLLAAYFVVQMGDDKTNSTFDKNIVQIDTALVDRLELTMPAVDGVIELIKSGAAWNLSTKTYKGPAEKKAVTNLLSELNKVQAQRVVAKAATKWNKYQVGDSLGKRLKIYQQGQLETEIVVGKFSYSQQAQTTFLRIEGDERVYGTAGLLAMTIGNDANSYRSKEVLKVNVKDLTSIALQQGDSSVILIKQGEIWNSNIPLSDSAAAKTYVDKLATINHYQFNDLANINNIPLAASLAIKGNNMDPIEVKAYQLDSAQYVVTSTQNPSSQFECNQFLYDKLFGL